MKIKEFRAKAGLTQQALADTIGVSDAAVVQWEKGQTVPRVSHLKKLASLFGCTVDELLEENNEES